MHKKYIRKNGKTFGPYLYETKRVNGKVVTTYVGKHESKKENNRKITHYSLYTLIIILLLGFFISFSTYIESIDQPTGTLQFSPDELPPALLDAIVSHQESYEQTSSQQDGSFVVDYRKKGSVVGYPETYTIRITPETSPESAASLPIEINIPSTATIIETIVTESAAAEPPAEERIKEDNQPEKENDLRIQLSPSADNNIVDVTNGLPGETISLDLTEEIVLTYELPPQSAIISETEISSGKRIVVSGDEQLTDTLILYQLPDEWNVNSIIVRETETGEQVSATFTDVDNDGDYDVAQWIIDHFSERVYDIIVITEAYHLDENRIFISDIFDDVTELDDLWSEPIPDTHYVRVVFERPLTSDRDITIYPRTLSGTPQIEIYEVDGTEQIASFKEIIDNQYNRVILKGLQGRQDTFDLRIIGGSVSFNHIIDPPITTCGALDIENGTYTLQNDLLGISGDCFEIDRNNITLNGQEFSVTGTGNLGFNDGIDNSQFSCDITVENILIDNFNTSINGHNNGACAGAYTVIENSSVNVVNSRGANSGICLGFFPDECPQALRNQHVVFINSSFNEVQTFATESIIGFGGNVTIIDDFVNIDNTDFDVSCTGFCGGDDGKILINYTDGFTDSATNYGPEMRLAIVNRTLDGNGTMLDWQDQIFTIPSGGVSSRVELRYNYAFYSATGFPQLNRPARIFFSGAPGQQFPMPEVFKNGAPCPVGQCTAVTSLDAETVIVDVTGPGEYQISQPGLTSCQSLLDANTTYFLGSDIVVTDDTFLDPCFLIRADNVTLNGLGHTISGDSLFGEFTNYSAIGLPFGAFLGGFNFTLENIVINGSFNYSINGDDVLKMPPGSPMRVLDSQITSIGAHTDGVSPGGSMIITNSNVSKIFAGGHNCGPSCLDPADGNQSSIVIIDSPTPERILAYGGPDGPGGNVTIINDFIILDGTEINLTGSLNASIATYPPGVLTLNYTEGFSDVGVQYGENTINLLLENRSAGAIYWFNETNDGAVDATQLADLPSNIEIGFNSARIDASTLSTFENRPATITLYNFPAQGIGTPSILRNGVECGTDCTALTALADETVIFTVSDEGNYTLGEGVSTEVTECRTLDQPNTLYNQKSNITSAGPGACIIIAAPNITFDGEDNWIQGPSVNAPAILSDQTSTTIRNVNVSMSSTFGTGIELSQANNSVIETSFLHDQFTGILIDESSNVSVSTTTLQGDSFAIWLTSSDNNLISNNEIDASQVVSLIAQDSSDNIFSDLLLTNAVTNSISSAGTSLNNIYERIDITNSGNSDFSISSGTADGTTIIDTPIALYDFGSSQHLIIINETSYGTISFTEGINGSGTNLSDDIRLTFNSAQVNSASQEGLNRSADIILLGLPTDFSDPLILQNDLPCDAGTCSNTTSLNAGDVQISVTSWTNYSIGESQSLSCGAVLDQPNTVYTLEQDIVSAGGNCITITADNVTLDGAGHSISGTVVSTGIVIETVFNTTIKNITLIDHNTGMVLNGNVNSTIINALVTGSSFAGIRLENNAESNLIVDTLLDDNLLGLFFGFALPASHNTIASTIIDNSQNVGIVITAGSFNNTFDSTIIEDSTSIDLNLLADAGETHLIDSTIGSYSFSNNILSITDTIQGSIFFTDLIDGSGFNLSNDIRIENNLVTVSTETNEGLNRSAIVTLENVPGGFTNPTILRNDVTCDPSVCYNFTALDASTVIFNVSYWTNYSIGEGPPPTELSACGTLDQPDTRYTLQQNILSDGTCFIVTADNVTLDGAGFNVVLNNPSGGFDYGVDARGTTTFTAEDIIITGFNASVDTTGIMTQLFVKQPPAPGIEHGGNLTFRNSRADLLVSDGAIAGSNAPGNGGTVFLENSTTQGLFARGGSDPSGNTRGGFGGNAFATATSVDISDTTIDLRGGSSTTNPSVFGSSTSTGSNRPGRLTVNYTETFNDANAIYQGSLYLTLINDSTSGGSIAWVQRILTTGMADLSAHTRIDYNRTFVNSTTLPMLDRTALVALRGSPGLPFVAPAILQDGVTCDPSVCYNFTALNALIVIFNVSEWSAYSIGEALTVIDISISPELTSGIVWDIAEPPVTNDPAIGNNAALPTLYNVTVQTSGVNFDVYVRASSNLVNEDGDVLGISNETFTYNTTDSTVPPGTLDPLTFNYIDNKIGDNLADGTTIHLKFFLSVPTGQPSGLYNNSVEFIAMETGVLPP